MAGGLTEKVAIVTGGNSGIGEATVYRLTREGARVAILARRQHEGDAVVRAVAADGGSAIFVSCDVSDRSAIDAAIAELVTRLGRNDIRFNNAGGAFAHVLTAPG